MKCKIAMGLMLLCAAFSSDAWASIVLNSEVESRYFKVLDNRSDGYDIARSWRWWLQAHRAIAADPSLKRKFSVAPLDLENMTEKGGEPLMFKSGMEKIKKLGLTPGQLKKQPTHVYTLHLASYRNQAVLQKFVKRQWLGHRMNQYRVYKNTPKQLIFGASGDVDIKRDPLYVKAVTVKGRRFTRLCYGVYGSMADAAIDRKILEHHLGIRVRAMREQPTTELVRQILFKPVKGRGLDGWETG